MNQIKQKTTTREKIGSKEKEIFEKTLVIKNDDINTFDWIIQSLIEVCEHSPEQAEQCALIIHFKGKASVNHGETKKLTPQKKRLVERGIDAIIASV